MKVVSAEQMRSLDRRTIDEIGIPGAVLMENAGRGAARCLAEFEPATLTGRVVVVAGRGNNGGDGHVIARLLFEAGADVHTLLLSNIDDVRGDARINLDAALRIGVPVTELPDRDRFSPPPYVFSHADAIVDAMLGTGLSKDVKGAYAEAIEAVNASRAVVLAVDLPSGLSADTGRPLGAAVYADLTATFGLPKIAHVTYPGLDYCGQVEVVDIGIPGLVVDNGGIEIELTEEDDVFARLSQPRDPEAHKGDFGHAVILAGSTGFTGAGVLAAKACARIGAGLTTLGVPRSIALSVESRLSDAMTLPLAETADGGLSEDAVTPALTAVKRMTAIALGPGIGTGDGAAAFVRGVLKGADVPVVVDADGLNCLGEDVEVFGGRDAATVLTPHPGEMARLLGASTKDVQADRIAAVRTLAERTGAVCVLKGARTLVATPSGRVFVNPTGNPGLATGGTGDVLTGLIAGLLAQGVPPLAAAVDAVYLHGLAADRASEWAGQRALVAGDLLEELPLLLSAIESGDLSDDDD